MDESSVHRFSLSFAFPLCFTRDTWDPTNRTFLDAVCRLEPERRHRVLVVVDDCVARSQPALIDDVHDYFAAFPESLDLVSAPVIVPGGEGAKNDVTHVLGLLQRINDVGLDRQSFVAVIGGGAVLDMVSFAAAIAHRSVRVIRLPTTVLSQADSGVGVKNGINLFGKKNFIGSFVPPFAVINDSVFLESLDHRDRIAGVSEAIKVALLKDPALYEYIELNAARIAAGDSVVLDALIRRSAELHLRHICGNGDPFEFGSARPLDFGHWAAHKLESMTAFRLRHGEAVAIGMAIDILYSVQMGYLPRASGDRILAVLRAVGFDLWDDVLAERDAGGNVTFIAGLREFREHLGGELHVTLIRDIGECFEVTEMDEARVAASVEVLAAGLGSAAHTRRHAASSAS